jgi:riboflavin biosynthesis pyrimidine reductase
MVRSMDSITASHARPLYAPIASACGMFVIGQLGKSLDGRIATPTRHSHTIGAPEAITDLHRLRALCDAVVAGISAVPTDDLQLTTRRCEGPSPVRVVIDPNGRLHPNAYLLREDRVSCIALQSRAFASLAQALDGHVAHLGPVDGVLLRLKRLRSLFRLEFSLPPHRLGRLAILAAGRRESSLFFLVGVPASEGCR